MDVAEGVYMAGSPTTSYFLGSIVFVVDDNVIPCFGQRVFDVLVESES